MNLYNVIEEIEKVDPDFQDKISPRRAAIKNITSFGSKVAVAALPFALGSLFKKAYAQQSTTTIVTVLNYALTLEYLESNFYNVGLGGTFTAGSPTPTQAELAGLALIRTDEANHVTFLRTVISQLGGTPIAALTPANFDFTARGTFPNVFTNFDTFLAVAETFEDTGVRAYKGKGTSLLRNKVVLTAALNIHSVEARHASHLRMLRRARQIAGGTTVAAAIKPWITGGNDTGIGASVNAVYGAGVTAEFPAESNVTQGGVNITTLAGVGSTTTSTTAATESFDEPLDEVTVRAIVAPFIR